MIIDFHTHTFPDELADRAVGTLAHSGGIHNYLDGRVHSLTDSMKKAGIDYSVLLPVATKPNQCDTINTLALKTNETSETIGLISFGAIHPACENFREILNWLSNNGFKGIKEVIDMFVLVNNLSGTLCSILQTHDRILTAIHLVRGQSIQFTFRDKNVFTTGFEQLLAE